MRIVFDDNECNSCGECVDVCMSNVLYSPDGEFILSIDNNCTGCEACMDVCVNNAIRVVFDE